MLNQLGKHMLVRLAALCLFAALLIVVFFANKQALNAAPESNLPQQAVVTTTNMSISRYSHTATLLPNGNVVVMGGYTSHPTNSQQVTRTIEIYNSTTGEWSSGGKLLVERASHSATLLPNGKILVVGGLTAASPEERAELYDPETGTSAPTGAMNADRVQHTATLLANGKVLVIGGNPNSAPAAELYDPATNSWSLAGTTGMRLGAAAVLLSSGKVLVAGGRDQNNTYLANAALYDPTSNSWTAAPNMANARVGLSLTLLPNSKVLAVGGISTNSVPGTSASVELYDPATNSWSSAASLQNGRHFHSAVLLPNGKLLVTGGGFNQNTSCLNSAELYNPLTNSWSAAPSLNQGRCSQTATLLPGGQILVAGGFTVWAPIVITASTELYDVSHQGSWKLLTNVPVVKGAQSSTKLQDGRVLVIGIDSSANPIATIYNPTDNSWTATGGPLAKQDYHSATLLPSGKVLIAGGVLSDTAVATTTVQLFNPATNSFAFTGSLNQARAYQQATLLPDGRVLVEGGSNRGHQDTSNSPPFVALSSAEIYNPASGTWTNAPNMASQRVGHTATLLANGKVLVVGGTVNRTQYLKTAELYDPITNSWSPTGSLSEGRISHTATRLNNGKILAVGGTSTQESPNSVEIYDPATGIWSLGAPLHFSQHNHGATLLNDGRVLITDGFIAASYLGRNQTEIYDPVTNSWSLVDSNYAERYFLTPYNIVTLNDGKVFTAGGSGNFDFYPEIFDISQNNWRDTGYMIANRYRHTSTLLPDGKVLVAGGKAFTTVFTSTTTVTSSAEIYNPTTGTWAKAASLNTPRADHTATLLTNGRVLVVSSGITSTEIYNPLADSWQAAASTNFTYISHTATLLPDRQVFVAGAILTTNGFYENHAEIYNPATNTWQPLTVPNDMVYLLGHTATLLNNGKILIVVRNISRIYDPLANQWAVPVNLVKDHLEHSVTLLADGRILIAGGIYDKRSAEVYNPTTNTWQLTEALKQPHFSNTTTLLLDGRVLIAGDIDYTSNPYTAYHSFQAIAEIYNPATNTWSEVGHTIDYRQNQQATLLLNGQVLVTGGFKYAGHADPPAELFDLGLDYQAGWQPQISTANLNNNGVLNLIGSGFRGISEGSTGNFYSSPTNYPLVQIRRLDNGQIKWLNPLSWTSSAYSGQSLANFPNGYALITVFANGIPSKSIVLGVDLLPCIQPLLVTVSTDNSAGTDCGTLSYAINYANSLPATDTNRIITFDPTITEVKVSGDGLPVLNSGLTINGGSCASNPPIKINGNGLSAPLGGLRSQGGITLKNLWVFGFNGPQVELAATNGTTKANCLRVSRN